jgi:DNA-binding phage protein
MATFPMRILERKDIVQLLWTEVQKAGSQTAWAEKNGLDRTHVSKFLHGARPPSDSIVGALGLRKAVARHDQLRILDLSAIHHMLRAEVALAGSQSQWARKNRMSRPYINKVLRKGRLPSQTLIRALGLRIVVISD